MTRTNPPQASGLAAGPHRAKELEQISLMVGIEGQILAALGPVSKCLKDHPGSSALLGRLRTVAEDHIEAWRVRMLGIGGPDPVTPVLGGTSSPLPSELRGRLTATAALQFLYTLISRATLGYSILHLVAHRQCDSGWGIEEGNSADLAEEHLTDYLQAVQIFHILVSDLTVWELSREGLECRCVCPSCGLGICMCATHGTARLVELSQAAMDPGKALAEGGLSMLSPPRANSVALRAGLDRGDVIVGLDGQPVATKPNLSASLSDWIQRLEKVILGPEAEESLRLRVRRPSGQVQEVAVTTHSDSAPLQERRLAAIMFTDMVGFTSLAQKDEPRALELLEEHRALVRGEYPRFKGREIKTMGDAFLLEFASALDAASCAMAIQRALRKRNRTGRREKIQLRIGIHVGDLISVGGDIFGDAVNIASRIEPMAEPGGICVTQQVYDQIWNKLPAKMAEMARAQLKNVKAPVAVYRLVVPTKP